MSGKTFSDFSALGFLRKEFEKNDASAPVDRTANVSRSRNVTQKTKDETLAEQKARENGLRVGMRVTLMDSNDRGLIRAIKKDCVEIELDYGIVVPLGFNEFIINDSKEDFRLSHSFDTTKSKDKEQEKPLTIPKNVEIDLHIEALPGGLSVPKGSELSYQLEQFRSVLSSQMKHRGSRVVFVHGVGDGILKKAIRDELDTTYALSCSWNPYGDGATAVVIK